MVERRPNFRFRFPDSVYGVYDTSNGTIYIFGAHVEDQIENVISHESVHWTVQKVAGKEASLALDNISKDYRIVE